MIPFPHAPGALGNFSPAQYVNAGKLHLGGIFSNYMLNAAGGNLSALPAMYLRPGISDMSPSHPTGLTAPSMATRFQHGGGEQEQGLDFRRSSIDKLRMKAKEHSTGMDRSSVSSSPEIDCSQPKS